MEIEERLEALEKEVKKFDERLNNTVCIISEFRGLRKT